MYVAPGLLDRRLRVYERAENGADGFIRPQYRFVAEWWGRVDRREARQTVPLAPQGHVEARSDAIAHLGEQASVQSFGLLKDTLDDALYYVRGVVPVRQVRLVRVALEAIEPTDYATFEVFEGEDVLDGEHLVGPEES